MNFDLNNNVLTIYFEGQINSNNAKEKEDEINEILSKNEAERIELDFDKLTYISSAGLRIILRIKQTKKNVAVVDVHTEVYEVFEMTGFTEMMEIKKALRQIDVTGCKIIGTGANGTVYKLNEENIVKVYKGGKEVIADIDRERSLARKAFVLGIPTAIPFDVVKVGDLYGAVFELLNARSFVKLLLESEESFQKYMAMYEELAYNMNHTKIDGLPSIKDRFYKYADTLKGYVSDELIEKYVRLIDEVPETGTMIHGDFHVKNIMMQGEEALIIDMDTLSVGHPVFELGCIFAPYCGFTNVEEFLGIPEATAERMTKMIIERYVGKERVEEVLLKAGTVGMAFVASFYVRHRQDQAEPIVKKFVSYLEKVDTLVF